MQASRGQKWRSCSHQSRGISPTSHHFRHLPSPIQNHAHKDATRQQAGKSLQAEPWTGEERSSESGSYEAGEIKDTSTQTGNALPVCHFDPFRDVRQIQGTIPNRNHSGFSLKICIENRVFEIMEHEQRSMDAAKNIRNLQCLCCIHGDWQ